MIVEKIDFALIQYNMNFKKAKLLNTLSKIIFEFLIKFKTKTTLRMVALECIEMFLLKMMVLLPLQLIVKIGNNIFFLLNLLYLIFNVIKYFIFFLCQTKKLKIKFLSCEINSVASLSADITSS